MKVIHTNNKEYNISSVRTPLSLLALLVCLFSIQAFAQGPGGIGDGAGTNGPRNVLWLDATSLSALTPGDDVITWTDKSGNGNNLSRITGKDAPTYSNTALDGTRSAVSFGAGEDYLRILDNATLDGFSGGVSIIVVMKFATVDTSPRGIISKRNSSSSQQTYSMFTHNTSQLNFYSSSGNTERLTGGTSLNNSTNYILSNIYDGANQYVAVQSVIDVTPQAQTGTVATTTSNLILGALDFEYGTYLHADIAEVILYGDGLTQAQRLVVENYLSQKYAIPIANDFWSDANASYFNQLAGIGQTSYNSSEATSAASGMLRISESEDLGDDEWLFWDTITPTTQFIQLQKK